MSAESLTILWLTLRVATVATLFVGVPGIAFGYLLARFEFRGKNIVSAVTGLPLVLPPTAVGLLLLRLFAHDGPLDALGIDLDVLLTWRAAVVAAATMSLPLVVRTARVAFEGVDPRLESMSRTLGHGRMRTFFGTTLPLARRGLIAALILGFTRALGEFGATVTIAGNIPGKTQTLASGISAAQQAGNDARANVLIGVALVVGFAAILSAEHLSRRRGEVFTR
ncbi:MAG: molybdate transport system permease protein [Chlamydiales bacterium]|jgi:molybdate transport system permease protein